MRRKINIGLAVHLLLFGIASIFPEPNYSFWLTSFVWWIAVILNNKE